jgi:hypothetical protein
MQRCKHDLSPATCWDCREPIRSRRPEPPEPEPPFETGGTTPDSETGPRHRAVREARDAIHAKRPADHKLRCTCPPCELATLVSEQAKDERNRDSVTGNPRQDPQKFYAGKGLPRITAVNWGSNREPGEFRSRRDQRLHPPELREPEDSPGVAEIIQAGERRWHEMRRDPEARRCLRLRQADLEREAKTSRTAALVLAIRNADTDVLSVERWHRRETALLSKIIEEPHIRTHTGPIRQDGSEAIHTRSFQINDELEPGENLRRYAGLRRGGAEFRGWKRVRSAVQGGRLNEAEERAVVAFWDEGSFRDAAAALGITEQGFRASFNRALGKLP